MTGENGDLIGYKELQPVLPNVGHQMVVLGGFVKGAVARVGSCTDLCHGAAGLFGLFRISSFVSYSMFICSFGFAAVWSFALWLSWRFFGFLDALDWFIFSGDGAKVAIDDDVC
ncbi:hypothetical protein U1Q18_030335 [Sarracenia purpurea var. burkii]